MNDLDKILAHPRMWTRDTLKEALTHASGADRRRIQQELNRRGPITFHRPKLPDMSRAVHLRAAPEITFETPTLTFELPEAYFNGTLVSSMSIPEEYL